MQLKRIKLFQFRSHSSFEHTFEKPFQIFLGPNGAGKTNIVEAVHILSHGDSFRFGEINEWVEDGKTQASLAIEFVENNLDYSLKCQLADRKEFFFQNKKCSQHVIGEKFPSVLFSPESLSAVKGASDERRRLVDEVVAQSQPFGREQIGKFTRILKSRNRILKQMKNQEGDFDQNMKVLQVLTEQFVEIGSELVVSRLEALKSLSEMFQETYQKISGTSVDISVEYVISTESFMDLSRLDLELIRNLFAKRIQELILAEAKTGTSLVGPHKNDIRFLVNGKDSRTHCSQGQQRALIIAFKMAQIVYHRKTRGVLPLLLLDDVLSELDETKQRHFLEFLDGNASQVLLTATELPQIFARSKTDILELKKENHEHRNNA